MRVLTIVFCLLLASTGAVFAEDVKPLPEQKLKRETLAEAIAFEKYKETAGQRQAQLDAAERAGSMKKAPAAKKTAPPPAPPAKK